ncbi:MAG: hypothetical protein IKV06_07055, partial [Alistipes sp.]|nr:hypothetical protein [Alistipes sp.]
GTEIFRGDTSSVPLSPKSDVAAQVSLFDKEENIKISESSENAKNEMTDIFSTPIRQGKRAERVIVLYSDGSFENYDAATGR